MDDKDCPICYEQPSNPMKLPCQCSHVYCKSCIGTALSTNARCPMCRQPILINPQDYDAHLAGDPFSHFIWILLWGFAKTFVLIDDHLTASRSNGFPHWEILALQVLVRYLESHTTASLWPGFCLVVILAHYTGRAFFLLWTKYVISEQGHFQRRWVRSIAIAFDTLIRVTILALAFGAYLSIFDRLINIVLRSLRVQGFWTLTGSPVPLTLDAEWLCWVLHFHTCLRSAVRYAAG